MADIFTRLYTENENKKDPFTRLLEANERQNNRLANILPKVGALNEDIPTAPVAMPPQKTVADQIQDLAVTGVKAAVAVPQTAVGLVDLVDYGLSTATKGYQEIGAVLGLNERPNYEIQTGRVGNFLEDNTWLKFKEAQEALDSYKSEASQKQQQEYQQLAGLSTDKSLADNVNAAADITSYALENPSLPTHALIESLPSMFLGTFLGRGAGAGISALSGRSATQAGVGEGLVMAGAQQESIRSQTPGGLTTPQQSNLAIATGGIGGLVGAAGGRIANKLGLEDVETSLIQRQAGADLLTQAANQTVQRNALTKAAGSVLQNSAEEFIQTIPESINENVALDKPLLDQVGQNVVLATMAGGLTSAGMSSLQAAPTVLNAVTGQAKQVADNVTEGLTQTTYADLTNPSHEKYNPAAAYNDQLQYLAGDNEELRQTAQANITKLQDDALSHKQEKLDNYLQLFNLAEQGTNPELESDLKQAGIELQRANSQYLDLEKAKAQFESNQSNEQVTSESTKSNIELLTQAEVNQVEPTPEQQAAKQHVTTFMSQYDSHELQQLADSSMFFSPEQKDSLRQLAEVKVLQNQNKGISQVSNDISFGLKGNTPRESHRGIQDYQDLITTAVAKQDPQLIETVLTDLEAWTNNHANKSEALKQAADMVGNSTKKVQVVALGNNEYRLIQDPKQFLPNKELRANGGFEFHRGSNQSGIVERVAKEAELIGKTYQALSNYASSFSFNQENNNPDSSQNTETTNSTTNSIDIPETQVDSTQTQQDITPPSLEGMELVFNEEGVGSVQPTNLSQESTATTVSEPVLTPNETSIVNSQLSKERFGEQNERQGSETGGLVGTGTQQQSESTDVADNYRENARRSDGNNASDSQSARRVVGANSNTDIPVNQSVLLKDVILLLKGPEDTNYANYLNSLLSKFLGYLPNVNFMLVDNPEAIQDSWERGGIDNDTIGLWGSISNTIYLNKSASNLLELSELEVVTHELQHAITEKVGDDLFNSNSYIAIRDELLSLMQQTANALESNLPPEKVQQVLGYALSHPKEFLAVGTTNLDAINYLKSIKTQGNGQSNLLKQIANIISKLLGLNSQESNVYLRLIDITGTMADAQNSNPSTVSLSGKLLQQVKSESGLIHHIPENLLGASHKLGDIVNDLLAMTTENVEADQYSIDLLNTIVGFNPDIEVIFIEDLQTVNDPIIREGVSLGGFYPISKNGEEKVYIYPRGEWESDVLSLVNHELSHAITSFIIEKELVGSEVDILKAYGNMLEDILITYADQLSDLSVDRIRYASDKVDETQAVLTSEPQVRKDLQALISNDVLDLFDSTVESIRITQRDYLNESNKQNKSTSVGTKTSDGSISSANQGTAGNTANNASEDQGSSNKQGSSLTTETDQGSGRSKRGNKEHSGILEGSQRQESVTQSNFESNPKAPVPALQGIDKAKRIQERSKPFRQRNLVTAHFDQAIKTNNPLVSVANFMSSLKESSKQIVEQFVKRPVTKVQEQQLQHYLSFHKSLAGTISKIFKVKPEQYRYQDYSSFLVNAQGQLDENTLTALTLAAYSSFIETGLKTLNTNTEIAELLHLDEGMYIPSEVADQYRNVGQQRAVFIHSLGKKAAKFLGLKVRRDSDPKFQSSLEGSLGALVYMALRSDGLIQETVISNNNHVVNLDTIYKANNQVYVVPKELGFEYTYSRIAQTKIGQVIPLVQDTVQKNEGTKGFLSKLFANDVGLRAPLLEQPTQFEQVSIVKTSSVVSSLQTKNLANSQKNGFKIRPTVAKVMQDLFKKDRNYLFDLLGIAVTDQALDALHITQRENFKAKAENEQKALFNAFDFINGLEFKDGEYQTFWDTQYTSSNNRMYYNSNLFNVQSQQIHRTLAGLEAFKSSFDPSESALDEQGKSTGYGKFLRAVAENMEGLENTKLFQEILPNYAYRTVDKVPSSDFLPAFEEYLNQDYVTNAIETMAAYIKDGEVTEDGKKSIRVFVNEGGMGVQSLYALINLAEHHNSFLANQKEFTTYIGIGSDGVNNGVAIANILSGVASENMRLQVGLIPRKQQQELKNFFDTKKVGIPDYYVEFAQVINRKWDELKRDFDPKQVQALEALFPSWGKRKMAKVWAVPFNYNASFNRLKSVMAEQFITDIYAQMSKIANLAKGKAKTSMQYQEALSLRNALQANLNTLLGDRFPVSLPAPELLNDFSFDNPHAYHGHKLLQELFSGAFSTFGVAAEQATQEFASNYIKGRDLNVAIHKAAYKIYDLVSQKVQSKVLNNLVDQGSIEKEGYEGLSTEELDKIQAELLEYAPVLTSALGRISENPLESGLRLIKSEVRLNQDNLNQLQISHFALNGQSKTQNIRVGVSEQVQTDIGIAGLALQVQSVDAAVSSTVIGNTKSINVHDQNISGIESFEKMTDVQNKAFFNLVGLYRAQAENVGMLIRTLQGVRDLATEYGINAVEFNSVLSNVLGGLPNHKGYLPREHQGLLYTLKKIGFSVDNGTDMSHVLDILINDAYRTERFKVGIFLNTYAVHQYAGEGGEFLVGDSNKDRLTKELATLDKAQKTAIEIKNKLGVELNQAFEGTLSNNKKIGFESSRLTPLESWFEQRLDQPIDFKDLKDILGKTLSQKEQVILKALDKLLPPNLFINYFNSANVPATVSVEGIDLRKVHAWYNVETNTINIKSVASRGSKVNSSTILHELLHAALAQRIHEVQTNPGKYSEAEQAIANLNELRNQLLSKYSDNPTVQGMLENLDEFISYGLTEPNLQKLMQAVLVDRKERSKFKLKSLFQNFVSSLSNLLGFRGKQIHALGAFVYDTASLIQSLEPIKPEPTVGMLFSQYGFNANDHVKGLDTIEVFSQLDATNNAVEHSEHLNQIIQTTLETVYRRDNQAKAGMDQLLEGVASAAAAAGFTLTDKELYTQEAVKAVLDTFLDLHSGGLIGGQITKTFEAAKSTLQVKDLITGNWDQASEAERDVARSKYAYLFGTKEKDYISRFMSMAITNEEVRKLLSAQMPKQVSKDSTPVFDRLSALFNYVLSWLSDKYAKLGPKNSLSQRMDKLLNQLTYLDTRARQQSTQWHEYIWTMLGKATSPLNRVSGGAANFIFDRDVIKNNRFKTIRVLGKIASLTPIKISEEIPQKIKNMRDRYKPNERLGVVMELINEVSSPTALRNKFDGLVREANHHAQARQDITAGTKRSILESFKNLGKDLTKSDHKAITNSLLRTDIQNLLRSFTVDEVVELVKNSKLRTQEAIEIEQEVLTHKNGNDMLIRTKQLAYYMIHNKGGDGLVKNAVAIASGIETTYQSTVLGRSDVLVQKIDTLVSLYALNYVDSADLKRASELLEEDANAFKELIQLHSKLVEDAYRDFEKNPLSFTKGYLPEIVNPFRELRVATSQQERNQLLKEGWKFISELSQDPNDVKAENFLMIHNDRGYQRIVSGAIDLMETSRKGTEAISRSHPKFVSISKQRLAASQRRKQNYKDFDPSKEDSGFIASYDTDGLVLSYNYELSGLTRDTYLERNHNFADLLGAFAGTNYYKPVNEEQHIKVAEVLYDDYKKNYAKSPRAYVALSPYSTDPKLVEMWRMLPFSFRQEAIDKFGKGKPIIVRNDVLNIAFGFKKYSLAQMFEKLSGEHNFMEQLFVQFGKLVLGDAAQGKIAKAEHVVQEIVRLAKDIIVIRSISVLWGNVISNFLMLAASGINPVDVLNDWTRGFYNARKYQKTKERLIGLEAKLSMGGNSLELENEISQAQFELDANPLSKYINAGLLSSIVEDVAIQQGDYTYTSEFKKRVDEYTQWIPSPAKTTSEWLMISPNTAPYQFLATTTQLSDFVSKYSLAEHLQRQGKTFDESVTEASQMFINYDLPTSRGMQYMNDVGLFMFTKFFLRIQAVLLKQLDKRAASVIGQHMAVEMFTDMPGILDPFMMNRIGNIPLEGSAATIFSAVGENPIVNVVF